MRKNIFLLLILAIFISGACKSAPEPTPVEEPPPPPPPVEVIQDEPPPPPPPPPPPTDTYRRHSTGIILDGSTTYTVQRRDRLNTIARKLYNGDGALYPLIAMVSPVVKDVDKLQPGMRLTVPDANINLNDPIAREAMNKYFEEIAKIEERRGRQRTAALIRNHIK